MVGSANTETMKTGRKDRMETLIPIINSTNPYPCPFRLFKDSELSVDTWGMGPDQMGSTSTRILSKVTTKSTEKKTRGEVFWSDPQVQPLMMSARMHLRQWKRAEQLAYEKWGGEVIVCDEDDSHGMSIKAMQITYSTVICTSLFVRMVLSACFMLEKVEGFVVEHQNENFTCAVGPEGWRVKYHIYSPGMKSGGGPQHKCILSKNGCYLVRLFYLGAWRCVWVDDLVPVNADDNPLLPFQPNYNQNISQSKLKMIAQLSESPSCTVDLWPLLICKALLKLMAPNMNWDREYAMQKGERQYEFDILHALTGALNLTYFGLEAEKMWNIIKTEVPMFCWDEDDDGASSTAKSKITKKLAVKDNMSLRRNSMLYATIRQTSDVPVYLLPGLVPSYENYTLVEMARDVPLRKPLPEPDVAPWKQYRWVEWSRSHGMYAAYNFPRTKFLKVTSLMKMSLAPHLLDVNSATSLTKILVMKEKETKKGPVKKVKVDDDGGLSPRNKEERRDWILFKPFSEMTKSIHVLSFPSMYQVITATNYPSYKNAAFKNLEVQAPLNGPLYFQINGLQDQNLKISLSTISPIVLKNCRVQAKEYLEASYLILESFKWFEQVELPKADAYLRTRGYDSIELNFEPGRHYFRLWVHSNLHWHLMMLSNESMLLGGRDVIMASAVEECPWTSKFLLGLGTAFTNWLRVNKSQMISFEENNKEFYQTYQPDLPWVTEIAGCIKKSTHWMFEKTLESILKKRLSLIDFHTVCTTLRSFFRNPDFGMPEKNKLFTNFTELVANDPCDCQLSQVEAEEIFEQMEEGSPVLVKSSPAASICANENLLSAPFSPFSSVICQNVTDELSCGLLKQQREMIIRFHQAATKIQSFWRGSRARIYLRKDLTCPADVSKILAENVYGHIESLSMLMNEFFVMFPGTKHAYSVASALSGGYKLEQFSGEVHVTNTCKWIPFFRKSFFCHKPVKVHIDLNASVTNPIYSIYNNDTSEQLPQLFNAFITFDIKPNISGYTVIGYGTLTENIVDNVDAIWNLTILCSSADAFHICDNKETGCKPLLLTSSIKFQLQEIFVPNRRNIMGGLDIYIAENNTVSFRAAASCPNLKMKAVLKTRSSNGDIIEIDQCFGKGELFWPYIKLITENVNPIAQPEPRGKYKTKESKANLQKYKIELIALDGWPLTHNQWIRALEVLNNINVNRYSPTEKEPKLNKEKSYVKTPTARKNAVLAKSSSLKFEIDARDAYVDIECGYNPVDPINISRDNDREAKLAKAIISWSANDAARAENCRILRDEIRLEHLVPEVKEEVDISVESQVSEENVLSDQSLPNKHEQSEYEMETDQTTYLNLPPQLMDNFVPLDFLSECMKPKIEGAEIIMTPSMVNQAESERLSNIEKEQERMNELDLYNNVNVLEWQKTRAQRIQNLFVDHCWKQGLEDALIARDEAISHEIVSRQPKPKLDSGKKKP